ncbi:DNA-binding response regulator, AraC family, partial [hydrothermal vent metagenome]
DKIDLGKAYVEYAGFQYYNKDYKNAIPNYLFGLNLLDSLNYKGLGTMMARNFELSQSFGKLKDYKDAFKYLNKAFILQDSLNANKQDNLTLELEKKYQTQKKEQEIVLLKSQKANQRNVLIGVISLISLISLFFFFLFRNRQKTAKKLKELDKAKSNFFANISHEFRTPLTLISMPIQEALHDNSLTEKKRSQFEMAQRNSERLLSLVNQVLELSKIDSGDLKLQIQEGNILQLISGLSDSFSFSAKQNHITFKKNIDTQTHSSWFDKDAIEKIVVNLLSNAIKYTPRKGYVVCNASVKESKLYLEIKNSGVGLTKVELKAIFQRFYQTNEQNQGSGIGLSLVKELVELHKGHITVSSEPNKWTIFKVVLSIDKNDFSSKQIIKTPSDKGEVDIPIISSLNSEVDDEFSDNEKPILLIVEDNTDLITLIQQHFEASYNVLTAPNGDIGVKLALEHIPDLIISDIMMPVKDGIELTKTLKNNECTAHIPVILLTAKADIESHYEGVNTGADDYITKPFDNKLLDLKVKKLIKSRRKLQER